MESIKTEKNEQMEGWESPEVTVTVINKETKDGIGSGSLDAIFYDNTES